MPKKEESVQKEVKEHDADERNKKTKEESVEKEVKEHNAYEGSKNKEERETN